MKDKKIVAVMLAVGIGTFMSSLDSSVVNLAMPLIKGDYGVSLSMIEWISTAYLLVVSSLLLTFGRLSDLYGHKKIYSTGFIFFIIGSLLCGLSTNITVLIICRSIQALGAAMLFSNGPAIITNAVPPENRGKALSVTAIAVALGLCAGPVIGGVLSTIWGWQSIFFINIPIGLFGYIMVLRFIPKDDKKVAVSFDVVGAILIFVALLFILLPLNISGDYNIPPVLFVALIAIGLLLVGLFIFVELRNKYPMLNVRLFKNRIFAASNAAALFLYMAQFVMIFLAPFYLQTQLGYTAMVSGLLYLPMPIATMCIAPISGSLSDKIDSRYLSVFGAFIMACGLLMLSFLNISTTNAYIICSMIITGIGFGLFQTPNNSAIMGNVPPQNRGTASSILATMRNIGMVLGVAISGALFSYFKTDATRILTQQGQVGQTLQNNAFTYALRFTFLIAVCIALVSMVASVLKGKVKTEQVK